MIFPYDFPAFNEKKENIEGISIIVPVYNRFNYLFELLKNIGEIVNDSKIEVILIDDGSEKELIKKVPHQLLKSINGIIIRNQINLGIAYSRNKGAFFAKKSYLIFIDSDDLLPANSLNCFFKIIKENYYPDVIYGNNLVCSHNGNIIKEDIVNRKKTPSTINDFWELFIGGFAQIGAMCIRRSFFYKIGGFKQLYGWDDCDFQYRIILNTNKIIFSDFFHIIWRVGSYPHATQKAELYLNTINQQYIGLFKRLPRLIRNPIYPTYRDEFIYYFFSKGISIKISSNIKKKILSNCISLEEDTYSSKLNLHKSYLKLFKTGIHKISFEIINENKWNPIIIFEMLCEKIFEVV